MWKEIDKRLDDLQNKYTIRDNNSLDNSEFKEKFSQINSSIHLNQLPGNIRASLYANFTIYDKIRIELEAIILFKLNQILENLKATKSTPACIDHYKYIAKNLVTSLAMSNTEKWNVIRKSHLICHITQNTTVTKPSLPPTTQTSTVSKTMGGFAAYYCNQQIMNLVVIKYSLSPNNETVRERVLTQNVKSSLKLL